MGPETEVPWFLLGHDAALRRPDDGVALAAAAGALCGQGLEVEETTSRVGRRATVPSQGPVRGQGWFKSVRRIHHLLIYHEIR